jgi:hypothetical protein
VIGADVRVPAFGGLGVGLCLGIAIGYLIGIGIR